MKIKMRIFLNERQLCLHNVNLREHKKHMRKTMNYTQYYIRHSICKRNKHYFLIECRRQFCRWKIHNSENGIGTRRIAQIILILNLHSMAVYKWYALNNYIGLIQNKLLSFAWFYCLFDWNERMYDIKSPKTTKSYSNRKNPTQHKTSIVMINYQKIELKISFHIWTSIELKRRKHLIEILHDIQ